MQDHVAKLHQVGETARTALSEKFAARERALPLCREAIQHCANSIRAVHRGELAPAQGLLGQAAKALQQVSQALQGHPDVFNAGFLHDAQKEFAEANATLAFAAGTPLPGPKELGVELPAYLNGLGEAVGELRRYILDALRRDDVSRCEELLEIMDEVYTILVTMDFPDALTGGLRRTTDMVRGVLERTRGDLTVALRQRSLERHLAALEGQQGRR
ncbi:MAG: haloacid dehalogenase [Chloroflexi bacterium]|nr:haloacid dehalogenase [Chloroflexota bacterium]